MKNLILVILLICISQFISCTSTDTGEESSIERSSSKPGWILTPVTKDDSYIYVSGEMTSARDRSFGMNQAYADALRKLLNMMENDVKTQSSMTLRGANMDEGDVARFSEFAVAWISQTYTIANIENPEIYWEKTKVKTDEGIRYYYDCHSRIRISKKGFRAIIEGAFTHMKKKARDENNQKAEETANKLIDELKNGK